MPKVLFLYETMMPTVNDMQIRFASIFANQNIEHRFVRVKELTKQDVLWADSLFLVRSDNYISKKVAKKYSKLSKPVIFFMDDYKPSGTHVSII